MSYFKKELARRQAKPEGRRWLFVPYDQLTDEMGPLSREDPRSLGIVLVESPWKEARRVLITNKNWPSSLPTSAISPLSRPTGARPSGMRLLKVPTTPQRLSP